MGKPGHLPRRVLARRLHGLMRTDVAAVRRDSVADLHFSRDVADDADVSVRLLRLGGLLRLLRALISPVRRRRCRELRRYWSVGLFHGVSLRLLGGCLLGCLRTECHTVQW